MSNISLLSLQQVIACVQPDEDFAPPPILFYQGDGVTPISLDGINFIAKIGALATLTNDSGGGISISGNSLTFLIPAAQKCWSTGRYGFTLLASDGSSTKDVFAYSSLTVGQPASFTIASYRSGGMSAGLAGVTSAELLALIQNMTADQQQSFMLTIADAQASYIPNLDFSHVANSQYIGSTPFLFTVG